MFQLNDEERIRITGIVVQRVNGKIPVITTGIFSGNVDKNSELIKKLFDTGVDAVIINSNQLNEKSETEDAFKRKVEELLKATGSIPLGIYECPVPYKRLISPSLMKWLGETGRFLYHKDTCCNIDVIRSRIKAAEGTVLGVYNANTPTGLLSIRAGASGLSPIAANFYPELYSFMLRNVGEDEEKSEIVNRLITVLDEITDNVFYPYSAKLFLKMRGLNIQPVMRLTKPAMDQQDYLKLSAMLEMFYDYVENLGITLVKLK